MGVASGVGQGEAGLGACGMAKIADWMQTNIIGFLWFLVVVAGSVFNPTQLHPAKPKPGARQQQRECPSAPLSQRSSTRCRVTFPSLVFISISAHLPVRPSVWQSVNSFPVWIYRHFPTKSQLSTHAQWHVGVCAGVCALTSCVWIFICIYAICLFASWKIQCMQCNAKRVFPLPLSLSIYRSFPHCTYFSLFGSNIFLFGFCFLRPVIETYFCLVFNMPPLQMDDSVSAIEYTHIYPKIYIHIYIKFKDSKRSLL